MKQVTIWAALLVLAATSALAADHTLDRIDSAEAAGRISADQAALNRIYYLFSPEEVAADLLVEDSAPRRCATMMIHDIRNNPQVSAETKALLQRYLDEPFSGDDRATYYSPGGHFQLSYVTTGSNAVPSADSNSNGTPDFVEWCGEYMDYSWATEIDDVGFTAPYISGSYYQVGFQNMSDYGYTTVYGATTRIYLHRNFYGFPANDDPDGNQKGAAKVTCAHEFKHASQYTTSHWTEGGWVELDAVWTEELVYPQTNDYHNYIAYSGSPLYSPEQPLDQGGSGSYEDCIWQIYQSETYGNGMIVDLWDMRHDYPAWPMLTSYNNNLANYGSSLSDAWEEFIRWNYLTGYRAVPGFGYPDAPDLYAARLWQNTAGLPSSPPSIVVSHLATRNARHHSVSSLPDYPKVIFDGQDGVDFRPLVFIKKLDSTVIFDEIEVDPSSSDGEKILSIPFSEISELGLSFPNCEMTGYNRSMEYDVETAVNTGVDGMPVWAMKMSQNHPNPFNPRTAIRFELSHDQPATLTVLSATGRRVRTLLDSTPLTAGDHEIMFDGRDEDGNALPSGVYFAKLNTGGAESHLVKMTLLK